MRCLGDHGNQRKQRSTQGERTTDPFSSSEPPFDVPASRSSASLSTTTTTTSSSRSLSRRRRRRTLATVAVDSAVEYSTSVPINKASDRTASTYVTSSHHIRRSNSDRDDDQPQQRQNQMHDDTSDSPATFASASPAEQRHKNSQTMVSIAAYIPPAPLFSNPTVGPTTARTDKLRTRRRHRRSSIGCSAESELARIDRRDRQPIHNDPLFPPAPSAGFSRVQTQPATSTVPSPSVDDTDVDNWGSMNLEHLVDDFHRTTPVPISTSSCRLSRLPVPPISSPQSQRVQRLAVDAPSTPVAKPPAVSAAIHHSLPCSRKSLLQTLQQRHTSLRAIPTPEYECMVNRNPASRNRTKHKTKGQRRHERYSPLEAGTAKLAGEDCAHHRTKGRTHLYAAGGTGLLDPATGSKSQHRRRRRRQSMPLLCPSSPSTAPDKQDSDSKSALASSDAATDMVRVDAGNRSTHKVMTLISPTVRDASTRRRKAEQVLQSRIQQLYQQLPGSNSANDEDRCPEKNNGESSTMFVDDSSPESALTRSCDADSAGSDSQLVESEAVPSTGETIDQAWEHPPLQRSGSVHSMMSASSHASMRSMSDVFFPSRDSSDLNRQPSSDDPWGSFAIDSSATPIRICQDARDLSVPTKAEIDRDDASGLGHLHVGSSKSDAHRSATCAVADSNHNQRIGTDVQSFRQRSPKEGVRSPVRMASDNVDNQLRGLSPTLSRRSLPFRHPATVSVERSRSLRSRRTLPAPPLLDTPLFDSTSSLDTEPHSTSESNVQPVVNPEKPPAVGGGDVRENAVRQRMSLSPRPTRCSRRHSTCAGTVSQDTTEGGQLSSSRHLKQRLSSASAHDRLCPRSRAPSLSSPALEVSTGIFDAILQGDTKYIDKNALIGGTSSFPSVHTDYEYLDRPRRVFSHKER